MESVEASDFIFKIIALGNQSVGKTSVTIRFANDTFSSDYKMTLGMNLSTKNVKIHEKLVQVAIWDVAGQTNFQPLLPMYYRGAFGALVIYDITNRRSFESANRWIADIRKLAGEIPIVIVGNKKDLEENREVTEEEGRKLSAEVGVNWEAPVHFKETSAKDSIAVDETFYALAESIMDRIENEDDEEIEISFDFEQ